MARGEDRQCGVRGELCSVKLQLTYDIPRGPMSPKPVKGIETPLTERWVIENGSAWYVYR